MRRPLFAASALLLCLFMSACASSKNAADLVPDDFLMVFGEGGGFTGQWTGYTIDSEGSISSWDGLKAEENLTPTGKLSDEDFGALWTKIDEGNYFETLVNDPGNMTKLIRLTANGETRESRWASKFAMSKAEESPLDELLGFCRDQVLRDTKEKK